MVCVPRGAAHVPSPRHPLKKRDFDSVSTSVFALGWLLGVWAVAGRDGPWCP